MDDKIAFFGAGLIFGYVSTKIDWSDLLQVVALSLMVLIVNVALRAFWWYMEER